MDVDARRRSLQDWCGMIAYFTEGQWQTLSDPAVSELSKVEVVIQHSLALGLQTPNEMTFQFFTALLALTHLGFARFSTVSPQMRHETLKGLKSHFKRLQSRSSFTGPFINALPVNPAEFLVAFPAWQQLSLIHI